MTGFSWVLDDEAAGMPRPGVRRPLDEDLAYLRSEGVTLLVTLTENELDQEALARHGITGLHIPIKDFHAPTIAQIELYVWAVNAWNAQGWPVGTHCYAGRGRTGTMLAALLVSRGLDADEAIAEVRRLRPGSIETDAQEQAIHDYAASLN
jgi:atypical dual specificity phosphatase